MNVKIQGCSIHSEEEKEMDGQKSQSRRGRSDCIRMRRRGFGFHSYKLNIIMTSERKGKVEERR